MTEFAYLEPRGQGHPTRRPFSVAWLAICLGIAVGAYLLGTPFFKQLAIAHPGQIDGIMLLVVFLVGGTMAGSWLFIDQGGAHNLRWYIVGAAVIAAAIVGVHDGKQAQPEKTQGMFREAQPAPLPER
jgi:hypothetical protein